MSSDNLRIVPTDDPRFNRADVRRRLDRGYSNTPSAALDTIAALRAVDALASALRALVERDGLYLDGPGTVECVYCPAASERHGDPVPHEAGCPIAMGRRVLASLDMVD